MNVEQVNSVAELSSLARSWRELVRRVPDASVFQDPDWALPWLAHFGTDRQVQAYAIFEHGELRALLPLIRASDGALEPVGTPLNDRNELLAVDCDRLGAWRAVWAACGPALRLRMAHVPERDLRACAASAPGPTTLLACEPSPLVRLPDSWERYCGLLPRSRRRRWLGDLARLERRGGIDLVVLAGSEVTELELRDFWCRRIDQWRATGRLEELDALQHDAAFPRFLVDGGVALAARGRLVLTHLCAGGRRVASGLYLLCEHRALDYMRTYDRTLRAFGPGTLCTLLSIRYFIQRKTRIYDFGRGAEPYKFKFLAEPCELAGIAT